MEDYHNFESSGEDIKEDSLINTAPDLPAVNSDILEKPVEELDKTDLTQSTQPSTDDSARVDQSTTDQTDSITDNFGQKDSTENDQLSKKSEDRVSDLEDDGSNDDPDPSGEESDEIVIPKIDIIDKEISKIDIPTKPSVDIKSDISIRSDVKKIDKNVSDDAKQIEKSILFSDESINHDDPKQEELPMINEKEYNPDSPEVNQDIEDSQNTETPAENTDIVKSRKRTSLTEFIAKKHMHSGVAAGFKAWLRGRMFAFDDEWEQLFNDYNNRTI